MALTRTCVKCGKNGANRIEVALSLWSVAEPDQPTTSVLGDDACEECQADVIETMQEHVREMMREQAPIHAEKRRIERAIDAAQEATRLRPTRKARDTAREQIKKLTADLDRVNQQGTALSDKRVAIATKALQAKRSTKRPT